MDHPRLRRCSIVFAAFDLVWVGGTVVMLEVEPWFAVLGALGQFVWATIALLAAGVVWWRIRPRGRGLAWLLSAPLVGGLGIAATLAAVATIHWGC